MNERCLVGAAVLPEPRRRTDSRSSRTAVDRSRRSRLRPVVIADAVLNGTLVRTGRRVLAFIAAANRDPAFFADPDVRSRRERRGAEPETGRGSRQTRHCASSSRCCVARTSRESSAGERLRSVVWHIRRWTVEKEPHEALAGEPVG